MKDQNCVSKSSLIVPRSGIIVEQLLSSQGIYLAQTPCMHSIRIRAISVFWCLVTKYYEILLKAVAVHSASLLLYIPLGSTAQSSVYCKAGNEHSRRLTVQCPDIAPNSALSIYEETIPQQKPQGTEKLHEGSLTASSALIAEPFNITPFHRFHIAINTIPASWHSRSNVSHQLFCEVIWTTQMMMDLKEQKINEEMLRIQFLKLSFQLKSRALSPLATHFIYTCLHDKSSQAFNLTVQYDGCIKYFVNLQLHIYTCFKLGKNTSTRFAERGILKSL